MTGDRAQTLRPKQTIEPKACQSKLYALHNAMCTLTEAHKNSLLSFGGLVDWFLVIEP